MSFLPPHAVFSFLYSCTVLRTAAGYRRGPTTWPSDLGDAEADQQLPVDGGSPRKHEILEILDQIQTFF